jgi:hypothetical protein
MKLIPLKKRSDLCLVLNQEKEALSCTLNAVFAEALRAEQVKASHGHIKNNTWTRLKTLFVLKKTKKMIPEYPFEGTMQCCSFVVIALFRAIEEVNRHCQRILSADERVIEYPFDPFINPAGLTPSSLKKMMKPMCSPIYISSNNALNFNLYGA